MELGHESQEELSVLELVPEWPATAALHRPHAEQKDESNENPSQASRPLASSRSKMQLRLNVEATTASGADAFGHDTPAATPSPHTPLSARTKWNAILQRLHNNTAQLLSRKPGCSPTGRSPELPLSSGPVLSPQGRPCREFDKFVTLKQRLREVKQSTQQQEQRHSTNDSDDSSTVMTETSSVTEGKLQVLLAQSPVNGGTAAMPAAAAARATGINGGLNLIVRRFKSSSTLQAAIQPAVNSSFSITEVAAPAAAPPGVGLPTSPATAAPVAAGAAAAGSMPHSSLAVRRSSTTQLQLSSLAEPCSNTASSATPGRCTTPLVSSVAMHKNTSKFDLTLCTEAAAGSIAAASRTTGNPGSTMIVLSSAATDNNSTSGDSSGDGAHMQQSTTSASWQQPIVQGEATKAVASSMRDAAVLAAATDIEQLSKVCQRRRNFPRWQNFPRCAKGGGWHLSTATGPVSCTGVLSRSSAAGELPAAWLAPPPSNTAPAAICRDISAIGASLQATKGAGLLLQLPQSRFPQHSRGGGCQAAEAAGAEGPGQQQQCSSSLPAADTQAEDTPSALAAAAAAPGSTAGKQQHQDGGMRSGAVASEPQLNLDHRRSSNAPHVFARFRLPPHLYITQEDILNDTDLRELLVKVEATCGGHGSNVHWHMHKVSNAGRSDAVTVTAVAAHDSSTGGTATAAAAAGSGGAKGDIHVHVDEDADGQLSVVISDMEEQEPGSSRWGSTAPVAAAAAMPLSAHTDRSSVTPSAVGHKQYAAIPAGVGKSSGTTAAAAQSCGKAASASAAGENQDAAAATPIPLPCCDMHCSLPNVRQAAAAAEAVPVDAFNSGAVACSSTKRIAGMHASILAAAHNAGDGVHSAGQGADGMPGHSALAVPRMSISMADGIAYAANAGPHMQLQSHALLPEVNHNCAIGSSVLHRSSATFAPAAAITAEQAVTAVGTLAAGSVVRLSFEALAAAEEQQQQQQASSSRAADRSYLTPQQGGCHGNHLRTAAAADTCDAVSSCCEGQSDLSALANPLAYADTLRQRMDLHLGSAAASRPAAADVETEGTMTPGTAARQLDEFIQGHKPLQQKAAKLKQGLQQRLQQKQQSQHSGAGATLSDPQQSPTSSRDKSLHDSAWQKGARSSNEANLFGPGARPNSHVVKNSSNSHELYKDAASGSSLALSSSTRQLLFPAAARISTAGVQQQLPAAGTSPPTAPPPAAAAAPARVRGQETWLLAGRTAQRHNAIAGATAASAGTDDGRSYFNVDELKQDLEACLRRVG